MDHIKYRVPSATTHISLHCTLYNGVPVQRIDDVPQFNAFSSLFSVRCINHNETLNFDFVVFLYRFRVSARCGLFEWYGPCEAAAAMVSTVKNPNHRASPLAAGGGARTYRRDTLVSVVVGSGDSGGSTIALFSSTQFSFAAIRTCLSSRARARLLSNQSLLPFRLIVPGDPATGRRLSIFRDIIFAFPRLPPS